MGAASPSLRASLRAAYLAFRDPDLIAPRRDAGEQDARTCPPLIGEDGRLLDARLARDFEEPTDEDLDDPEGATIASLTMPDLKVPLTRRTMRYVRFFARSEEGRATFLQRYRRAAAYRDIIERELREAGLPEDLLWLAGIESSFDPRAVSQAGAAGLWQFMPETGAMYGLYQSAWVDERRSLTRATTAAVAHLRDLYERFGRWDLALAAYNVGYDHVLSAMERVAAARDPSDRGPIGLAELAQAAAVPDETANYVPQILAFAIVAANRARFDLDQADLDAPHPLQLGELAVPEGTRLRTVARAAGLSTAVLHDYNPQLLRNRVPPTGGDYLVNLPADRVARTLATFPAYLDHEVLAVDDAMDADPSSPIMAASWTADGDALPQRPGALGKNRLPAFALPGQTPGPMPLLGDAMAMRAKLPVVMIGTGIGWRPFDEDPLGVLSGRVVSASHVKGREVAIEKQLGFLDAPQVERVQRFWLPSGVLVELRRDPSAPLVAISAGVAGFDVDPAGSNQANDGASGRLKARSAPNLGPSALGESRYTITVPPRELDVGVDLAAARLRLLLGEASNDRLAALRRSVGAARREALERAPYGRAWLALGETLFPAGHPLEGTILGARDDPAAARDLLLADALRRERRPAQATLSVSGDVTRAAVEEAVARSLGYLTRSSDDPVVPHPREERVLVEDAVPAPRVLYGWIAPGEGEPSEAALRVAMDILVSPRVARLSKVLVSDTGLATEVRGRLETGPRASVAAIEIAPAPGHPAADVERRFEANIKALATTGPTWKEISLAKALLKIRLEKELARINGEGLAQAAGARRPLTGMRLRNALNPGSLERLLQDIEQVSHQSVRNVVRRTFSRRHRVVVTTWPRGWAAAAATGGPAAIAAKP